MRLLILTAISVALLIAAASAARADRPLLPLPPEVGAPGHARMFGTPFGGGYFGAGAESGGASWGGGGGAAGVKEQPARIAIVCSEFSGIVPNGGGGGKLDPSLTPY